MAKAHAHKTPRSRHTHTEAAHRLDIEELLSKFPATGNDRFWSREPVARKGFQAAHRVFEKHFKAKIAPPENDPNA